MSMHARRTRRADGRAPLAALALPLIAALAIFSSGCFFGESVGDCVQVYEFEGTVRKSNYTRSECEEECSIIGRTLQCFFDGRAQAPLGVEPRYEFDRNPPVTSTR